MTNDQVTMSQQSSMTRPMSGGGSSVLSASSIIRHSVWTLLILCSSCASKDKAKTDYAGLKWEQRINKQMKDPQSISSPFQKQVYNAARSVKTQNFKAGDYNGKKGFSGADDRFKAGTFAQADKTSPAARQTFSGADDRNRMGDSTFKTAQSQYDGRASRESGRASSMADDVFKTSANHEAKKASENSKRPLIQDKQPSYSEEEVRKILNKG